MDLNWWINNSEWEKQYYIENNNIVLNDTFWNDISEYEFRKKLLFVIKEATKEGNLWQEELNIRFDVKNLKLKSEIANIISTNHPLLRINRLSDGDNIINFSFWWIKAINDSYWDKWDIDRCLDKIKNFIYSETSSWKKRRVIRRDYKNLSIWYPDNENLYCFENILSQVWLVSLIGEILDGEDNKLIRIFKENLEITLWASNVVWDKLENKLSAFYESEINSRMKSDFFDINEIKEKSESASEIETEIIEGFPNSKIELLWVKHSICIGENTSFWWINPVLIEAIRKWDDIWEFKDSEKLVSKLKQYIELLNIFDFIAPYININNNFEEIESDINEVEKWINKWNIKATNIEKNYKATLDRTALLEYSKWKEGLRIFIDIASMWIMNLSEFRALASKVASWHIREENKEELLESWMDTTLKFIKFVEEIQKKYPKAKVSLWWDEVFIFFPDEEEWVENKILGTIWESLDNKRLNWRAAYSFKEDNQEKLYNNLDSITFISKKIEKLVRKFTPVFNDMPTLVKVDIPDKIRDYIISIDWDYENILSEFLKNFEEQLLSKQWFNEKIKEVSSDTSNEINDIIWNEILLFTFFPEDNLNIKHNFSFKREGNILTIKITED